MTDHIFLNKHIFENIAKLPNSFIFGKMQLMGRRTTMPTDQETLGERAYALIRNDIIRGEFPPGQPLRLAVLQTRYGLGFSPLREALTRLTAEGLATTEAMRGSRVAPLSLDDLRDTMETRIFIETQALRRSIERGDDDWEGRILSTLNALGRQWDRCQPDDPASIEALEERHRDFHFALVAASGSRRLTQIIGSLYLGSVRYRMPGLTNRDVHRARDLTAEHSAIADATLARDVTKATDLLSEHYRQTAKALEAAHAGYFAAAV